MTNERIEELEQALEIVLSEYCTLYQSYLLAMSELHLLRMGAKQRPRRRMKSRLLKRRAKSE